MNAENWTAVAGVAAIVIAVATVIYMAVSIFQGRMMLKSFRLSLLQTLRDMATSKDTGLSSMFTDDLFLRLYEQIFPRDYKKVEKVLADNEITPNKLLTEYVKRKLEAQQLGQEFQKRVASNMQDPFLGMCADEPELMDEVTESIMQAREQHPLRQTGG